MVDTSHIDLVKLIGGDLRNKGDWVVGKCPRCGGNARSDRFYIKVSKNYFKCRQCGFTGGALDWIAYTHGLDLKIGADYRRACEIAGVTLEDRPRPALAKPTEPALTFGELNTEAAAHQPDWQRAANTFVCSSYDALRSPAGERARDWLRARGISDDVQDAYGLGFNSEDRYGAWSAGLDKDVWLPRGIIIPWEGSDKRKYDRVNIRRPVGDPKYISPAGWLNSLYNHQLVTRGCRVVMVEGEFDAMLLHSLGTNIVPVATGTVTGSRLARWVDLLKTASVVFTAFDRESVGYQAHLWWESALGVELVRRLRPVDKDPSDTWKRGGNDALLSWLHDGLRKVA